MSEGATRREKKEVILQDSKPQVITSQVSAMFSVRLRDITGLRFVLFLALKETENRFSSVGSAVTPTNQTPAAEEWGLCTQVRSYANVSHANLLASGKCSQLFFDAYNDI